MKQSSKPFIPPLPSSKQISTVDKENIFNSTAPNRSGDKNDNGQTMEAKARSGRLHQASSSSNINTSPIQCPKNESAYKIPSLPLHVNTRRGRSDHVDTTKRRKPLQYQGNSDFEESSSEKVNNIPLRSMNAMPNTICPEPATCVSQKDSIRQLTKSEFQADEAGTSTVVGSVLRNGETMESLFCITELSSDKHRSLCELIVDGEWSDNAEAWCKALEYSWKAEAEFQSNSSSFGQDLLRLHRRATSRFDCNETSTRLQTKHQLKFVLSIWLSYAKAQEKFSSRDDARLTYDYIQKKQIGEKDSSLYIAISEFELGDGGRGGDGSDGGSYESQQGVERAIEILQLGISLKASPLEDLKEKIKKIGRRTNIPLLPARTINNHQHNNLDQRKKNRLNIQRTKYAKDVEKHSGDDHKIYRRDEVRNNDYGNSSGSANPTDTEMHRATEQEAARRKEKNEHNNAKHDQKQDEIRDNMREGAMHKENKHHVPTDMTEAKNMHTGTGSALSARSPASRTDQNYLTKNIEDLRMLSGVPRNESNKHNRGEKRSRGVAFAAINEKEKQGKAILSDTRSSKLPATTTKVSRKRSAGATSSRTPRFNPKRLGGGAMRVSVPLDPEGDDDNNGDKASVDEKRCKIQRSDPPTMVTCDETFSAERHQKENSIDKVKGSTSEVVPKYTKTDLSYMLNWEPTPVRRKIGKNPTDEKQERDTYLKEQANKIGEETNSNRRGDAPHDVDSISSAATESTPQTHKSGGSKQSSLENSQRELKQASSHHSPFIRSNRSPTSLSPKAVELVAKSNLDFLPLVNESNMVRVNKLPYAKLGVIGKGGSCKVYRALTKDCSVVAIKKVKLDGMDKRAIDGYANEIALLQRLRGSPAIIQMFDSELDLGRKAIFLVMELGEIDLNHVLQQQAALREKDNKNSKSSKLPGHAMTALNINFTRLTWQQMLSAVHCIHEERVIHGDLKPANFLFVRGTLKLIDFGIAKAMNDDTTNIYRDSHIGTLNYMSPEAIMDSGSGTGGVRMKCGKASDIWSLGCILYQMVYGRTPFADLHMIQKLQAIVNPNHKIKFPDVLEEDAVDAMRKCLQRNPQQRPPIVGCGGLLNEHRFLNSNRRNTSL